MRCWNSFIVIILILTLTLTPTLTLTLTSRSQLRPHPLHPLHLALSNPALQVIGGDGKLLDGLSPVWQSELRWETLKTAVDRPAHDRPAADSGGGGSTQQQDDSLRARRRGTLVEFFDEFERMSVKFPAHKELVVAAKKAAKQLRQNIWPGMLLADYDWSENGQIAAARQIQSEYWCLKYFSLFIIIVSHLNAVDWCDRESLLGEGAEVTVEPEGAAAGTLEPASGSFYACVHIPAAASGESSVYTVKKDNGDVVEGVKRSRLRHRVFYTTAFACVTDEKRHDGYTTSHFLNKMFEHFHERIESGEFWAFIGHSDNASHFKSGQMMNYWSEKKKDLGLKLLRVDFGCPGHGKGPWDGLGAVLKQAVTRDSMNMKILTQSGYITSPLEVAEHLSRRVDTDDWRAAHKDRTIKRITVMYSDHTEIHERPVVEKDFEPLTGKMSSFSFLMLAHEQIARRERSCWCEAACMHAYGRDSAPMRLSSEGELHCRDCESGNHFDGAAYPWREQSMKKLSTSGVANRRREAQESGKELARKLKPGDFFAVQAREQWSTAEGVHMRPGHFWVAQASHFRVEAAERRMSINGTIFSKGDLIVKVGRYFDRDVSDPTGLTFEEWQPLTVFSEEDVGKTVNISGGVVKVNRTVRPDVCWVGDPPNVLSKKISKVDSSTGGWVEFVEGGRIRNPPTAADFVVNATELRAISFSMLPLGRELPLQQVAVRKSGRLAAVVSVPPASITKEI